MTRDERLMEQGRMVEERREARCRLACLANKAQRLEVALERACTAVRQPHVESWRIEAGVLVMLDSGHDRAQRMPEAALPFPAGEEVAELLAERRRLIARIEELDRHLA